MKILSSKEEEKEALKVAVAALAIIAVFFILAYLLFGTYFYHRTVNIKSDYEISDVVWEYEVTGEQHIVSPGRFIHRAGYGRFSYRFDLYVDGRTIPVYICVFKTNSWEHSNITINVCPGDTDSKIKVEISGYGRASSQFDIDDGEINLQVGP